MGTFFDCRDYLTSDDIIAEIFRFVRPDGIFVGIVPGLKRFHVLLFPVFANSIPATINWQRISLLTATPTEIRADKRCLNLLSFFELSDHIGDVIHASMLHLLLLFG